MVAIEPAFLIHQQNICRMCECYKVPKYGKIDDTLSTPIYNLFTRLAN
jgi:hypothetical protein